MKTINCRGKILDFSLPRVMGILNITPDSFYDKSRFYDPVAAMDQVDKMIEEGATIIDVGGMSTRPGAPAIDPEDELKRVIPIVTEIRKKDNTVIVSIDTFRAEVAKAAIEAGADMVNDISGGDMDKDMFAVVGERKVPYILMHMKGTPQNMQFNPVYQDVTSEVFQFFSQKLHLLKQLGIEDVIVDPGFGFGKAMEHNFELLNKLEVFSIFEKPVLTGLSRKSMLYKTTGGGPDHALSATAAVHMVALQKGAGILRVHDVKAACDVIKIWEALKKGK